AELTVKKGATLTIGNNVDITNGKIIIEDGATVNIDTDLYLDKTEILFHNSTVNVSDAHLDNQSKFWIHGTGTFEFINSYFSDGSQIRGVGNKGTTIVDYCIFNDSYIDINNNTLSLNSSVSITNNNFNNSNNYSAISIVNCDTYTIEDNEIDNYISGIEVWNSGHGKGAYYVRDNTIRNIVSTGLTFYGSSGIIENNTIENSLFGIKLLNNSTVELRGNSDANDIYQTQLIQNNDAEEVYISTYSVPTYFHYNVIQDYDNGGVNDPLVLHNNP
ncbi:hypothetical protein, partial [Lentimicrobium sp. S6]|uniref:hypothetical protein n=1 Tax=Lentimicrobium sp. S6 TaxID=2735872 RepID=UPI0015537EDD